MGRIGEKRPELLFETHGMGPVIRIKARDELAGRDVEGDVAGDISADVAIELDHIDARVEAATLLKQCFILGS